MKKIVLALAVVLALASCQNNSGKKPKTFQDSVSYAFGAMLGEQFRKDKIGMYDSLNMDMIIAGLNAGRDSSSIFTMAKIDSIMGLHQKKVMDDYSVKLKKDHDDFIAKNSTGLQKTASGLLYKSDAEGAGELADENDTLTVVLKITTSGGQKLMDAPKEQPARVTLNELPLPGLQEGIKMMKVGSKYKFLIPQDLAFGERPQSPGVEPYQALQCEIELVEVKKMP